MATKTGDTLERVGYFRAQNLSIFSLLKTPKRDAACLLAHIEVVDREFSQRVNIIEFSEIFCPKWKSGFQTLWRKYVVLFNSSRNVDNGIVATYMKAKKPDVFDYSATYVELLSFLFFIASIDSKSSFAWLFWMLFTLNEELPTKVTLIENLELLWGPNNDKLSKPHRVLMKKSAKYMDLDNFDDKKFRIYDWKSHGGFTTPFHHLQRELLGNIATRDVWTRLQISMREIIDNPDVVAARLGEKKKPLGRMKSLRSIGERRSAWFELCDFIEAFLRYHEMVDNMVIEPEGIMDKAVEATKRVARLSYIAVRQALPLTRRRPLPPGLPQFNDDLLDDQSLTKVYKRALSLPVDRLFMRAEKKKELAYGVLGAVENELSIVCEPAVQHGRHVMAAQDSAVSGLSEFSDVECSEEGEESCDNGEEEEGGEEEGEEQ